MWARRRQRSLRPRGPTRCVEGRPVTTTASKPISILGLSTPAFALPARCQSPCTKTMPRSVSVVPCAQNSWRFGMKSRGQTGVGWETGEVATALPTVSQISAITKWGEIWGVKHQPLCSAGKAVTRPCAVENYACGSRSARRRDEFGANDGDDHI